MTDEIKRQRSIVLVIAITGKANADLWWQSPNKAFDLKRPIDMPIEKVYEYLMQRNEGDY